LCNSKSLSTDKEILLCPNYPLGAGCPPLESLSIPFRTRGETVSSPGPLGQTPTMCEKDVISFRCLSCRRELSYRYGMLEPCRNRGHCYVHRSQREETAFTECESCTQKRGERDHENRRKEAKRSRRDRSAKLQRERGARWAQESRSQADPRGGRNSKSCHQYSEQGEKRRRPRKKRQLLAAGLLARGNSQSSWTFEMLVYSGRLMDGKHALFVPLEMFLSLPRPLDGYYSTLRSIVSLRPYTL
jgi:hypothetical protein